MLISCIWPGISVLATPRFKSSEVGCAFAVITCSKPWSAVSVRSSRRWRRRSTRSPVRMVRELDDGAALYRLLAWLSPSFPVGAFSYSSGIEWAVEASDIKDAGSLRAWIASVIGGGGGFCDAVFFVQTHRAIEADNERLLRDVCELAAAFAPSKERHLETTAQGRAFVDTVRAAWSCVALDRLLVLWDGPIDYPVAVEVVSAGHGIALEPALISY